MSNLYWIINKGDKPEGPYSVEQLTSMGIEPATKAWCRGMEQWQDASTIDELLTLFPPTPLPELPEDLPIAEESVEHEVSPVAKEAEEETTPESCRHTHIIATIVTTAIIIALFFGTEPSVEMLLSPLFYLLFPFFFIAFRSSFKTRSLWRRGEYERSIKQGERTVVYNCLSVVMSLVIYPFYVVAMMFL